ncbi:hypothetical protein [Psychrobium sp. 1_MG-2023]|uniref:hypothetical protein n=1 Tax=Psychrobium sp. 1_MG-2023 TaxID=3062624 RepID=UPI000C32FCFC|nr:hypothetical protein [Psychrobium sp. 1_MG-2023]MDP2561665.1 hypothetical protein [Psychrobium sp. 1_MG-2023]PKF57070.1 hypothetical protein CW748_08240 [Alteromonadales bacterium alter-6D02]
MDKIKLGAVCITLTALAGCQSKIKIPQINDNESNTQEVQSQGYFSEVKTALTKLNRMIKSSEKDRLGYYAPQEYRDALSSLADATEEYNDITQNGVSSLNIFKSESEQRAIAKSTMLRHIDDANKNIMAAYILKETAESALAEPLKQQKRLNGLNLEKFFPKEHKQYNKEINSFVEKIGDGKLAQVKQAVPALVTKMTATEVKLVKKIELGTINIEISTLAKNKPQKYIPTSYQALLDSRDFAYAVINKDPRDTQSIKKAVAKVQFQLDHATHIAQEVASLAAKKDTAFEAYLLNNQKFVHELSQALNSEDLRNQPSIEQLKLLKVTAIARLNDKTSETKLINQNTQLTSQVSQLEQEVVELTDAQTVTLDKLASYKMMVEQLKTAEALNAANLKAQELARQLEQERLKTAASVQPAASFAPQTDPAGDLKVDSPQTDVLSEAQNSAVLPLETLVEAPQQQLSVNEAAASQAQVQATEVEQQAPQQVSVTAEPLAKIVEQAPLQVDSNAAKAQLNVKQTTEAVAEKIATVKEQAKDITQQKTVQSEKKLAEQAVESKSQAKEQAAKKVEQIKAKSE